MGPDRVLRANIFIEDKIIRKDLNHRTAETQCLSLRLLFHCGIEGGAFGRPEGIVGTAHLFHFSPFTLVYLVPPFLCPAKLIFEGAWTSSKAVLHQRNCFSYCLR